MTTQDMTIFINSVSDAIMESLEETLESPDEDDWRDFKKDLCERIKPLAKILISASNKKKRDPNPYSMWISRMSHVRKGDLEGDEIVVVGNNFKSPTSASAKKYDTISDVVVIGQELSIKDLLLALKEALPNEKELALSAIAWGLVDKDHRVGIVQGP